MDKLNYIIFKSIRGFILGAMLGCYFCGCVTKNVAYFAASGLYAIAYAVMVRRYDDAK